LRQHALGRFRMWLGAPRCATHDTGGRPLTLHSAHDPDSTKSGHDVLYGRRPDGKWHLHVWHGGAVAVLYPAYVYRASLCVALMKSAEGSLI